MSELGWCEAKSKVCTGRAAHRHHILRRSQGGKDEPANLLAVCSACHVFIHDHPLQAYEKGWMRRSGAQRPPD